MQDEEVLEVSCTRYAVPMLTVQYSTYIFFEGRSHVNPFDHLKTTKKVSGQTNARE